jgi:hypothetical protein
MEAPLFTAGLSQLQPEIHQPQNHIQGYLGWLAYYITLRVTAGAAAGSKGYYFCLVLLLTLFFCFASIASNASDKCDGIDLSPRSHRETVIILTPSAFASRA